MISENFQNHSDFYLCLYCKNGRNAMVQHHINYSLLSSTFSEALGKFFAPCFLAGLDSEAIMPVSSMCSVTPEGGGDTESPHHVSEWRSSIFQPF